MSKIEYKKILHEAIFAAGEILKENFEGVYKVFSKDSINNLVTEIDKRAEDKIIEIIKKNYSHDTILSEECGELPNDSNTKWIIDPIDGTVNYAHGIPICCISIGLEINQELAMGAVYNPFMNELFYAEKGGGAFLNDKRIFVSEKNELQTSCLVTGFPYRWVKSDKNPIAVFESFIRKGLPVRRLGSAAIDLCWVACGRFDGFWEYNLNPWDIAAGYLIVEEAGGKITNFTGEKYSVYDKQTLATNGRIHDEMLAVILAN